MGPLHFILSHALVLLIKRSRYVMGTKMSPLQLHLSLIMECSNVMAYAILLEEDFNGIHQGAREERSLGSGVERKVDKRTNCPAGVFPMALLH